LEQDTRIAQASVLKNITVPLTNNQYDALVSFTFNLGGGALQRSTLRQLVNREEHILAAEEFKKWAWVGGRKMQGLIKRRREEAILYSEN
jgi:lysozyme